MKNKIIERVLSDDNIFLAIFTLDSYIQNKELLTKKDMRLLNELKDPFIDNSHLIEIIKSKLEKILKNEDCYFDVKVYFKPKKYDGEQVEFRPLHTANLTDQIAMVSLLQVLVYDDNEGHLVPSQLGRLIPNNFYGNRVAYDGLKLFKPWQDQYQQYVSDSNDYMYNCSKSNKYSYEVTLDLINFFPSINPLTLINFISSNKPNDLSDVEKQTFDMIIKKLTFFNLCKLSDKEEKWYYSKSNNEIKFVKGIPQGLPHSYFLANLFMILIKDEYCKIFPGEMFFYVDDSVIFTNGINGELNDELFEQSIKYLNEAFKKLNNSINTNILLPAEYNFDVTEKSKDFEIKVHNLNDKSSYYNISEAIKNSGELYLHALSRETSNLSFDIYSSYSSEELITLNNKTNAIIQIIIKELYREQEKGGNVKNSQYVNKLIRYNKFFSYRKKILDFITTNDTDALIEEIEKILKKINNNNNKSSIKKEFFNYYNEDIFPALINFTLNKCYTNKKTFNKIKEKILKLNNLLYDSKTEYSYLSKLYDVQQYEIKYEYEYCRYNTLYKHVKRIYKSNSKIICEFKFDLIKKFLSLKSNAYNMFNLINLNYMNKYSKYVCLNNNELIRMILNSVVSYLLSYEINDSTVLVKRTNEKILYSEIRILMYLRNNRFNIDEFNLLYESFVDDDYMHQIDYSLLQVLNYFKLFVKEPKRIDNLILTHKYCSDTWKNGSKYLYFYTLHNQEHAVSLIRSSIEIIHKISYFQIKPFDYYILFAACYLHDISMVSIPTIEKFYIGSNQTSNKIYTDFINQVDVSDSLNTKKALCDSYQKIEAFFENDIRANHAKDSANDIRKYKELNFFSESDRELIARISEKHGYDATDVYWSKSNGKNELINEKMVSILLRLSDLLDISRYRISKLILNHNLENLNYISRFHWLSHLITDGYSLSTTYELCDFNNDKIDKTFLKENSITEKLTLTINVLMSQTTKTNIVNKCCFVDKVFMKNNSIEYKLDIDNSCSEANCNFLCKWFSIKNNYLIQELAALKKYLNSVIDNYFNFDVSIVVHPIKKTNITNKEFDYLKQYLESK